MRVHRRLSRKEFLAALGIFAAALCLFLGVVFVSLGNRARCTFGGEYFFLVRDCTDTTAAAVAAQVHSAGGAGYLGEGGVIVACYYTARDAEHAQSVLAERGEETRVERRECGTFYVKSETDARRVLENIHAADACSRILFAAANALERAQLGQSGACSAVADVKTTLCGLRSGNAGEMFLRWNAGLHETERAAEEALEGLVFARDLRLMQVNLCALITGASDYF